MNKKRPAWVFVLIYTALSMGTEIILLVVFRLKIPQHNSIIAPIIQTIPPVLAAWIAGYRSLREVALVAALTAILTLVVTLTVTHFTKVTTGLIEPLINRPVASFLAVIIANKLRRNHPLPG